MAFMTHPKHGATNTHDVAGHESNGWSISTPEEWISGKNSEKPKADEIDGESAPKKRVQKPKAE